jgi:hypothetical protein
MHRHMHISHACAHDYTCTTLKPPSSGVCSARCSLHAESHTHTHMNAQIEVGLLGEQERAAILRLKMKGTPMSRDTDLAGTNSQKSVP